MPTPLISPLQVRDYAAECNSPVGFSTAVRDGIFREFEGENILSSYIYNTF